MTWDFVAKMTKAEMRSYFERELTAAIKERDDNRDRLGKAQRDLEQERDLAPDEEERADLLFSLANAFEEAVPVVNMSEEQFYLVVEARRLSGEKVSDSRLLPWPNELEGLV